MGSENLFLFFKQVKEYFEDFFGLFFPHVCASCGKKLLKNENVICTICLYHIPKTKFHLDKDNPVAKLFWGRAYIENATAWFLFHKGSGFQKLLHKLKYKSRTDIGLTLGSYFGAELKNAILYSNIDVVIPVPLHPKRQKKRGYNQSELIARGIAEQMGIPVDITSLYRSKATETQTKKSKDERWKNVENIFKIKDENILKGKHILLVDDVVTTGATLESCAHALLTVEGVKVSIACLAASLR